ncbi:nucleotide sugar dehydrogenase [Massilia antarctica]|uniref:nucleotide sugar dehydrogenase n=1 Tax=Massilia antarctica TaxID=2765360 RepID=UPI0006BB62DB|nr:nucleotide sugar dehydrogenase [Massilia sp. H27-R4]MCY0914727.1 nucleotide sugar dehydrogenase [Massilia sp. H27-R4]CUI08239.1 UDP-glucose dehydrogenase [Janthinobacterium sp. CG23_2]CUU32025.1 UDP-glucose dehydrogenase [Janthinobacterium sp. CG23_2]
MSTIGVIGLGYVGLPLVVEFAKLGPTIGLDISVSKVESCRRGVDPSRELSDEQMAAAVHAEYTNDPARLADADLIIVAVPTPVDIAHNPDFGPLIGASQVVGKHMKKGATVVYESTVYPGATEEVCIPVLEKASGLKWKDDFFVGYSPERINPGDKEHTLTTILKVVAGDTPETLEKVATMYEAIVKPGVHRCSSIKAAEACKVIENTQRDLNIALMNELAIIFDKIGIDTSEVLKAAGTKWNFLKFSPGLVGGHCIGVDPYYLTHKADMLGYHPQVILAGRRINDGMAKFIAEQTIKNMIAAGSYIKGAKVNVLGLTFKENCADLRNSKVADVITELKTYGVDVFVHDPYADAEEAMHEYGVKLVSWDELPRADALVAAVSHRQLMATSIEDFQKKLIKGGVFIDVKAAFDQVALVDAGIKVWRL